MPAGVRIGGVWLSPAEASGLKWSSRWGYEGYSGCFQASVTLDVDSNHTPPHLARGSLFEVIEHGGRRWAGRTTESEPGRPRTIHAFGFGAEAANYPAIVQTGGVWVPSTVPNAVVDAAIALGLPWVREESLGTVAIGDPEGQIKTVAQLMDAAAKQAGKRWVVDKFGRVSMQSDPTSPTWVFAPGDAYMGTADDDYVSHLYGYYVSAATGTPPRPTAHATVQVGDTQAAARWGRKARWVDLTNLGLLTEGQARAEINGRFALTGARMGWTNGVEGDDYTRHISGAPALLTTMEAGQMARIHGVADIQGDLVVGSHVDIVGGFVEVDGDGARVRFDPVGMVARDFESVLAAPPKQEVEVA